MLEYITADVALSGHSDPRAEGAPSASQAEGDAAGYELAGRRALTVLEYFVQRKLDPARFSVAGYGPDRPSLSGAARAPDSPDATGAAAADNAAGDGGNDRNRRVEILVKTTPRLGGYP